MGSFIYRSHLINVFTNLDQATGFWDVIVVISWHLGEDQGTKILSGLANSFTCARDSEYHGVEIGKAWVNEHLKS